MRLPKPENWTQNTIQRVIDKCWKLFDVYEKNSELDENGQETSQKAIDVMSEGMRLQDMVNYHDWSKCKRPF